MGYASSEFESGNRHMRWLSQKARERINQAAREEARLQKEENEKNKTPEQKKAETDARVFKEHADWMARERREERGGERIRRRYQNR